MLKQARERRRRLRRRTERKRVRVADVPSQARLNGTNPHYARRTKSESSRAGWNDGGGCALSPQPHLS